MTVKHSDRSHTKSTMANNREKTVLGKLKTLADRLDAYTADNLDDEDERDVFAEHVERFRRVKDCGSKF